MGLKPMKAGQIAYRRKELPSSLFCHIAMTRKTKSLRMTAGLVKISEPKPPQECCHIPLAVPFQPVLSVAERRTKTESMSVKIVT